MRRAPNLDQRPGHARIDTESQEFNLPRDFDEPLMPTWDVIFIRFCIAAASIGVAMIVLVAW